MNYGLLYFEGNKYGVKTGERRWVVLFEIKDNRSGIQGDSNMTGTDLYMFTHKSVPVIFEPPCIFQIHS